MIEQVIPGKPDEVYTCITAASRPDPAHCWNRAASHILRDRGFDFFVRLEAEATCRRIIIAVHRPWKAPVKWGWLKGWPGK